MPWEHWAVSQSLPVPQSGGRCPDQSAVAVVSRYTSTGECRASGPHLLLTLSRSTGGAARVRPSLVHTLVRMKDAELLVRIVRLTLSLALSCCVMPLVHFRDRGSLGPVAPRRRARPALINVTVDASSNSAEVSTVPLGPSSVTGMTRSNTLFRVAVALTDSAASVDSVALAGASSADISWVAFITYDLGA